MKSNVVLQSSSRELFGKNISVMSKDGYVCITEVMDILSEKRKNEGLKPRRIDDIMSTDGFQEKINALIKRLKINDILDARNIALQNNVLSISKLYDLKKYGMAYRKGKGENQKWFVNPYIFVMLALELDPELYVSVIIWLTDDLIENRNAAGDAYIKTCKSVSSLIKDKNELSDRIKRVAKAINYIVFNKHEEGIRNNASRNELNDIMAVEMAITTVIDGGFIKSYDELIKYLGNEWKKKWGNPVLNNI